MRHALIALATIITFATPSWAQSAAQLALDATAILYSQTMSGGMEMHCTTTAFERVSDGYLFASAAHCVASDSGVHEEVKLEDGPFFISYDHKDSKVFHPAEIIMAGYQSKGDDFAILKVESNEDWTIAPIGSFEDVEMGDPLVNVAVPRGLGKQLLFGFMSLKEMDRPVKARQIDWMNATLLQLPAGPGSSGSAVLHTEQKAIVAFVVGGISGNPTTVALSVDRFKAFRKAVEDGDYPHFSLDGSHHDDHDHDH